MDVRKSITSGLTNAVSGAIYGNNPMKSLGQAFGKGAAAGGVTFGINYLSDILGSRKEEAGDSSVCYQREGAGVLRERDPRRGCGTPNPFTGSMGYGNDYGYQYNVPAAGGESQNRKRFSFADFGKEVLNGIVTGGLASAAFYGAGKAVGALKESIQSVGQSKRDSGSDNYVYRALNKKDYERFNSGLGMEAKNPNGSWNLENHLVNGSGKSSWINDPYISTTSDINVAKVFNQAGSGYGIVKVDMSKVKSASYKGYEIFPRTNGKEGLPYHYSIWQQETSIYQKIPFEAIVDYFN